MRHISGDDCFIMTRKFECIHPYDEDMDKIDKDYAEIYLDLDEPEDESYISYFKLLINELDEEADFSDGDPMLLWETLILQTPRSLLR